MASAIKTHLPALVLHAGAGKFLHSVAKEERARESLSRIAEAAFLQLKSGGALECVVWAVRELENDPQFNAGTGGKLQADGVPRLSASLMDGRSGLFSGVINVEQVRNPILIAEILLHRKDRVLAAEGAKAFARVEGFGPYNPLTEASWGDWKRKIESHGTVGAVAVDRNGNISAATSTGGKGMEIVGRVSDSATVAGNFASKKAAVSATGVGEEIVEAALAVKIVTRVDDGFTLQKAFEKTFRELKIRKGRAGAIGVDLKGNTFVQTTTECILHAIRTPKKSVVYP